MKNVIKKILIIMITFLIIIGLWYNDSKVAVYIPPSVDSAEQFYRAVLGLGMRRRRF